MIDEAANRATSLKGGRQTVTTARMEQWVKEFPGAVTVCDRGGIVLSMNDKACRTFAKWGGAALVGKSLLDCHPEPARAKLLDLLKNQKTNVYTVEKNGMKKLIYQAPWYDGDQCGGMVELSLEIPFEIPHFIRA